MTTRAWAERKYSQWKPRTVSYLVSATRNPLYQDRFRLHQRYLTLGQHGFIYDLVAAMSRLPLSMNLIVDGLRDFPLAQVLSSHAEMSEFHSAKSSRLLTSSDMILLDEVNDELLAELPPRIPVLGIIHDATKHCSESFRSSCHRLVCMTEGAMRDQGRRERADSLRLLHQGVDLARLQAKDHRVDRKTGSPRVLVYSRLDGQKGMMALDVVRRLCQASFSLSLLGDGELFWQASDEFGASIAMYNFVPCHSIQHVLPMFDVVIGSGRGAMEALACSIPVISAGVGYGGIIQEDNIVRLLESNLTAYRSKESIDAVVDDVVRAADIEPASCRGLAERYCNVATFVHGLLDLGMDVAIEMEQG